MLSVLSVLFEGAWVPMDCMSGCSGGENQSVEQVEVGRGAECSETTVLGGSEGIQLGRTADDLQKSDRGGSRWGLERPWRSVGEGQVNSLGSEKTVTVLRDELFRVLSDSGHGIVRGPQDRRELPFNFRLLHSLLSAAGDPEVKMHEFAVGVRVGPGTKLPRYPQIYSKKKKWRMQEQREQQEVDEQLATRGVWNTNYSSGSSHQTSCS